MKTYFPAVETQPIIGQYAIAEHKHCLIGVVVIDAYADENRAKRVRVVTGEKSGQVLMPGEYEIVEKCDRSEIPYFLSQAWQELHEA